MPLLRLGEALSYIEENYDQPVALGQLASIAHLSKNQFLRVFKQGLGRSPKNYLIRLRIQKACELMRDPNKTITQISYEVGFNDGNYFSRRFKHLMGRGARDYRQKFLPEPR